MAEPVYLDHHATTPIDPRVLEAMLPYFRDRFGNASSKSHRFGWQAQEAVEAARAEVARLLNARPREVVFTSGATESCNLAIKGVLAANAARGRHFVTTAIEHPAVIDTLKRLAREGSAELTIVPVGASGIVEAGEVARAIRADTVLVSVMAANNEIGTLQPIAEVARAAREKGALFHTDATQAVGKVPVDVRALGVDLLSASAHKLHGPKGAGLLFVRRSGERVRIHPQIDGGGQETGLRSGTLAVPQIVGFGAACAIARAEMAAEGPRLASLRDRLLAGLQAELDGLTVNGDLASRLPNNLSLTFAGVEGEALLTGLPDVAVSSGAACSSGTNEPSHVLRAIGVSDTAAHATLRFGLGRFNREDEIDRVVALLVKLVRRLRALAPA